MNFRKNARFHRLTFVGLVFLVAASVTRLLLERHSTASEHIIDPIVGCLYGIAIGAMLLGIRRQTRQGRSGVC